MVIYSDQVGRKSLRRLLSPDKDTHYKQWLMSHESENHEPTKDLLNGVAVGCQSHFKMLSSSNSRWLIPVPKTFVAQYHVINPCRFLNSGSCDYNRDRMEVDHPNIN
jgi:hypothetical protein